VEYLAGLKAAGCRFATGSDSHAGDCQPRPQRMADVLARAGFREADFWPGPNM
jgi:hypothetical protein